MDLSSFLQNKEFISLMFLVKQMAAYSPEIKKCTPFLHGGLPVLLSGVQFARVGFPEFRGQYANDVNEQEKIHLQGKKQKSIFKVIYSEYRSLMLF